MTQIDFYVLPDRGARSRPLFACKLAEKVFGLGHSSFVHLASETEARELDTFMWTFHDRSFLPHCLAGEDAQAPIRLGFGQEPAENFHLLINLSAEVPRFFSRFERLAEILDGSDDCRIQGRDRYRFYKDRGYPLETHKL